MDEDEDDEEERKARRREKRKRRREQREEEEAALDEEDLDLIGETVPREEPAPVCLSRPAALITSDFEPVQV